MLSGQIFRIESNLSAQITVFGLAFKWDFFPGLALVDKSFSCWADAPGPAQSKASADLQSPVDRTGLSAPAWSLLELKPVLRELWSIVPGRVLTKLYQEASAVYRENLGCPLSSPDTPYGEKVQKIDNLRNKLNPVSVSWRKEWLRPLIQMCPKAGFSSWNPKTRACVNLLLQLRPKSGGHEDHPTKTGWSEVQDFPVWKKLPVCYKCSPVGLWEQPWFSVQRRVTIHRTLVLGWVFVLVLLRR